MKIENFRKAGKYTVFLPIILLVSIIFVVYPFVGGLTVKTTYIVIGITIFVVYLFLFIRKPFYFYFETKFKSILVRYYNPHPMFIRRKAFEVPIDSFVKYEIKSTMFGLRKKLTLFVKKGKKVGAYPSVSIILLDKGQIINLKNELDTLLKVKSL